MCLYTYSLLITIISAKKYEYQDTREAVFASRSLANVLADVQ
jgi:hypothetical protein